MLDSVKARPYSILNIVEFIEVEPPYFALDDFHWDKNNWLVAKAPVECPSDYECTLMNASEVGRHLAILGSCVGALSNPDKSKHYYLANHAELETYPNYISDTRPDFLSLRANAKFFNRRELRAETELLDLDGKIAAALRINYHVLKEKSFDRIYQNTTVGALSNITYHNPYKKNVNLDIVDLDNRSLTTSMGMVKPEMCPGHFAHTRALPVAILSQCFLNSSYMFLRHLSQEVNAKFVLKGCILDANQLATAGQSVAIHVELTNFCDTFFTTRCIGKNQLNEIVGSMICYIEKFQEPVGQKRL